MSQERLTDRESLASLDVQECPWSFYRAIHEERDGFYFDDTLNMYICASYPLMREILRDTATFSSVNAQNVSHMREPPREVLEIQKASVRPVNILVGADPPDHGRVRKLLDDPFRPRAIEKLRPRIREIVNDTIDAFIGRGRCDVVAEFAIPIPITVIAELLGLPRAMAGEIKAWSDASVEPLGMMISDERWIECARKIKAFQDYMTEELEARKRDPRDDLLTHLVSVRDASGAPLTLGEMLAVTAQLLVAGNETTTNGIAGGVQLLLDNPEQETALREDPSRMLVFVNEALRLESPVQGLFRVVTRDTALAGQALHAGDRIMIRFAAANRDGAKYEGPDALDVCRKNAGTQLGFGAGIHHCLGANLAREEMVQAFDILLARTRSLALAPDADLSHHPSLVLRGLKRLDITFEAV